MKLWPRVLLLTMSILIVAWMAFVTVSLMRLAHVIGNIRAGVLSIETDTGNIDDIKSTVDDIKSDTDDIKMWVDSR
jgi:hypothetical protein